MIQRKSARLRRARKARLKIQAQGATRLCVYRTPRHTYAQIIAPGAQGARVLVAASTLEKDLGCVDSGGNIKAAETIGKVIADRALKAGVTRVAFDRSGFKYHGRVKHLADAAREAGLTF